MCAQAGNVNSGAIDPLAEIAAAAREHGAWVHVDGAFGLWAAASPALARLIEGHADCDSWATDGHKWLNVPYDCGVVAIRDAAAHAAAMGMSAAYLVREADARSNSDWAPGGLAPRPRLRGLRGAALSGARRRGGVVERNCALARRLAERVGGEVEVLNDVTLNQVLLGVEGETYPRAPAGGHVLGRRHRLARPAGAALLRLQLVDHRGRHRPQRRRDPQRGSASARVRVATTSSGSLVSCRPVIRITL